MQLCLMPLLIQTSKSYLVSLQKVHLKSQSRFAMEHLVPKRQLTATSYERYCFVLRMEEHYTDQSKIALVDDSLHL